MNTLLQTPPKSTTSDAENSPPPIPNLQNTPPPPAACNSGKNGTPDSLTVPKPFKYSERYTSPTDQMMSPVSRGILARGRKGSKLLPPSSNLKIQALKLNESNPIPN